MYRGFLLVALLLAPVSASDDVNMDDGVVPQWSWDANATAMMELAEIDGMERSCSLARRSRAVIRAVVALAFAPLNLLALAWGWYIGFWAVVTSVIEPTFIGAGMAVFVFFSSASPLLEGLHLQRVAMDTVPQRILAGVSGLGMDLQPLCCCGVFSDEHVCGLVAAPSRSGASCPAGWYRNAAACETREMILHSSAHTVSGCTCREFDHCTSKGQLWQGHPWCETSGCGMSYKRNARRHWDYCKILDTPVQFPNSGSSVGGMLEPSPLAQFVPNTFEATDTSLKFMADGHDGVALHQELCFPGTPEEMLSTCARRCLEEGAWNVPKHLDYQEHFECHAFAFNFETRSCVRLPSNALTVKFAPFSKGEGGGWVNFVKESTYKDFYNLRHLSRRARLEQECSATVENATANPFGVWRKCKCPWRQTLTGDCGDYAGRRFFNAKWMVKEFDGSCRCE